MERNNVKAHYVQTPRLKKRSENGILQSKNLLHTCELDAIFSLAFCINAHTAAISRVENAINYKSTFMYKFFSTQKNFCSL